MKSTDRKKKLALAKTTLRTLAASDLTEVNGGAVKSRYCGAESGTCAPVA